VNSEFTDEVADLGAHLATHDIRKPIGMQKARPQIGRAWWLLAGIRARGR
jgi:hypothetical protein